MLLEKINLKSPTPDLFDTVAEQVAKNIAAEATSNTNKSTQLRKFYDELVMWEQKIHRNPQVLDENLPLIRMLVAKLAYAQGRGLISKEFFTITRTCISQIDDQTTLQNAKRFLEAILGFYKMYAPKN